MQSQLNKQMNIELQQMKEDNVQGILAFSINTQVPRQKESDENSFVK